jgi:hypothetical protein
MKIDENKINTKNNNILFGIKEINKVTTEMLSSKDATTSLAYLIKLMNDLEKDVNELTLIKSYVKEEKINER